MFLSASLKCSVKEHTYVVGRSRVEEPGQGWKGESKYGSEKWPEIGSSVSLLNVSPLNGHRVSILC